MSAQQTATWREPHLARLRHPHARSLTGEAASGSASLPEEVKYPQTARSRQHGALGRGRPGRAAHAAGETFD